MVLEISDDLRQVPVSYENKQSVIATKSKVVTALNTNELIKIINAAN